jgi:hypothetical protein
MSACRVYCRYGARYFPGALNRIRLLFWEVKMPVEQRESPDLSAQQHANKLIRLIRKLRWMGMEEEVKRVQTDLAECGAKPTDSVLVASRETD